MHALKVLCFLSICKKAGFRAKAAFQNYDLAHTFLLCSCFSSHILVLRIRGCSVMWMPFNSTRGASEHFLGTEESSVLG